MYGTHFVPNVRFRIVSTPRWFVNNLWITINDIRIKVIKSRLKNFLLPIHTTVFVDLSSHICGYRCLMCPIIGQCQTPVLD